MNLVREQLSRAVLALGGSLYGFTGFLRNEKRQSSALTASLIAAIDSTARDIAAAFRQDRETAESYARRLNGMKLTAGSIIWCAPDHPSQAPRLTSLEASYSKLLREVSAA